MNGSFDQRGSFRIVRQSWNPSIFGMRTSETTASTSSSFSRTASAASPSGAVSVSWPERAKRAVSRRRWGDESSTRRMRMNPSLPIDRTAPAYNSAMIGEPHLRLGADRFVTGRGRFVEDVGGPDMLHAAVLRSPHAHARLVRIDTRRALQAPGVQAVLTAADVPAAAIIPNRVPAPAGTERYLQPAIAREVVRYVGEPVALVVADDPYLARDALERIDAVYEPLPACPSTAAALAPGAPRLFAGTDSNN